LWAACALDHYLTDQIVGQFILLSVWGAAGGKAGKQRRHRNENAYEAESWYARRRLAAPKDIKPSCDFRTNTIPFVFGGELMSGSGLWGKV